LNEQQERNDQVRAENAEQCNEAKLEQSTAWFNFSDTLRADFTAYQTDEYNTYAAFVEQSLANFLEGLKQLKRLPVSHHTFDLDY